MKRDELIKRVNTASELFMQSRDLTDEEWMALPKEEILQLYKNCYSMLKQFIASHPEPESVVCPSNEIEKWAKLEAFGDISDETFKREEAEHSIQYFRYKSLIEGAEWLKSQLKQGYLEGFVEWIGVQYGFHDLTLREMDYKWIYQNKEYSFNELYKYWQSIKQESK